MPIVRVPVAGSDIIASASVFKRKTVTLAGGPNATITSLNDLGIQVNNLPNAFIYVFQTAGIDGSVFTPYFAVDNLNTAGTVGPNWLQLAPSSAIAVGVPAFFNLRIVGNMLTLGIDNPTANNATLQIVVGASQ